MPTMSLFILICSHARSAPMSFNVLQAFLRAPAAPSGPPHLLFEHFWVEAGPNAVPEGPSPGFVVTPSIAAYLRSLARAVLLKRYPILLQGHAHVRYSMHLRLGALGRAM